MTFYDMVVSLFGPPVDGRILGSILKLHNAQKLIAILGGSVLHGTSGPYSDREEDSFTRDPLVMR